MLRFSKQRLITEVKLFLKKPKHECPQATAANAAHRNTDKGQSKHLVVSPKKRLWHYFYMGMGFSQHGFVFFYFHKPFKRYKFNSLQTNRTRQRAIESIVR